MTREQANEAFVRRVQKWLGAREDGWAGAGTNALFDEKTGQEPIVGISHNSGKRVSPEGIALIHSFESLKLEAYPDPGSRDGNPWTIGWGSTGPGISRGVVWTKDQADARFASDLVRFEDAVSRLAPVTTQGQFDALVSFAYNVGIGALEKSTLLRRHLAGDYVGAKAQFGVWINNDGRPMNGLIRRRAAEAALYAK